MTTKKKTNGSRRAVLVTTAKRGVFFGYAPPSYKPNAKTIIIEQARCVVYWSADCKGFLGLAAIGPTPSCKVTAAAPSVEIREITSVSSVTDAAAAEFEKGYWA